MVTQPAFTPQTFHCQHCGNDVPMIMLFEGDANGSFKTKNLSDIEGVFYIWELLLCPTCANVMLFEKGCQILDEYIADSNIFSQTRLLYPKARKLFKHLPEDVAQSYEIACKLLPIEPIACAVFVGRTLEFLCIDRNAVGNTLDKMIKDLANRRDIPEVVADMAHSLRYFRNIGAHASKVAIDKDDAEVLLELCEVILEYVYEAPAMLQKVKNRISQPQT
jgi:hypothetical protein